MTPNELRKLLAQDEHPKLDFKIECSPTHDQQWNELIKDILALANGNVGFSHLPGHLVIGASDAKRADGTRDLKDSSHIPLKKRDLLAKINGVSHPRLPNLEFDWVVLDGTKILVITIPPTPHLYETKSPLQVSNGRKFQEQTVLIRCGDEIQPATQQERDEILADKRRAAVILPNSTRATEESRSWELLTDPNLLLPKLYNEENNDDPLAYHRIPYQPRDPERDIQLDLRSTLNQTRYLLITGRSGLGKTREAAMLAHSLMLEGYRVIRVKRGSLEPPRVFPPELQENHRRIFIFIDDLNFLFRTGEPAETRQTEEFAKPSLRSYRDCLLEMLDAFEKWCGESEIRVIATARDDADSWQVLNYSPKDRLWKRFTRFDLPVPKDSTVVSLLNAELANGNVQAEKGDFAAIARENDGTFANVVLNLQRAHKQEQPLTLANYTPTLDGSWRDVYERAVAKYPAVRYVYDAIDLLQQVSAEMYTWIVEPTACLLWADEKKPKTAREQQVKRALKYLTQEKILVEDRGKIAPRDGQIEAKGQTLDWKQYASTLQKLVLRLASTHGKSVLPSLDNFTVALYRAERFEEMESLIRKALELEPQDARFWSHLGAVLDHLQRSEEAEFALSHAVECEPNNAYALVHLGVHFGEQNRLSEAEQLYRRAITFDPSLAYAHANLGRVLRQLERFEEAEIEYRRAIELDPIEFQFHINLGYLLGKLRRFSEAEQVFHHASQLKPNDAGFWNSLASAYDNLERHAEAESALRRALECDADFGNTHTNLGLVLEHQGKHPEAEAAYRRAIQINPSDADYHYNLANLLKQLGRNVEAEEEYRQAIKLGSPSSDFYYELGVLLNELKRWSEAVDVLKRAVEMNPNDKEAHAKLGIALASMGRYVEAEPVVRYLTERSSHDTDAHRQLSDLLEALGREDEAEMEGEIWVINSEWGYMVERVPPLDFESCLAYATYCKQRNYSADLEKFVEKARAFVPVDDWFNLARLESVCGNLNASLDYLLRASDRDDFDPVQVSQDPSLEWIRDHPRFAEIVVVPDEMESDGDK